ncbi:MAG TPA: tetratricopeptide repeat protein [Polyangia bacterium]|jgi:tetratricopeptide (TPR) repeat protein
MAIAAAERAQDVTQIEMTRRAPREPDPHDPAAAEHAGVSPVGGDFFMHSAMLLLGRLVTETVEFYNRRFALERKDLARIYTNLARAARFKGHMDKALAAYQELIKLNPRDADAHLQVGQIYVSQGQHDRAANAFRTVVRLKPRLGEAHFRLGLCLLRQHDAEGALACFEQAVAIDPRNARAHHRRGLLLDKAGRCDEAIAALVTAAELAPDEVRYHQQLGFLYESAGRHPEAVVCFKRVLELESQNDDEV